MDNTTATPGGQRDHQARSWEPPVPFVAHDLPARFHLAAGRETVAGAYIQNAWRAYRRWGASAKAAAMRKEYPALLTGTAVEEEMANPAAMLDNIVRFSSSEDSDHQGGLEIHAIRQALRNMSDETDPGQLLASFLAVAVESAGADKGCLILEKNGELFIETAKEVDGNDVTLIEPVPLERRTDLALGVIRYVARTLETVVVGNDGQSGIFARDPYLARPGTRSIACWPLLFQGIPVGVLYLENTLMAGVFTEDRLETLKLLASQMAYIKKLQSYLIEDAASVAPPLAEPLTDRETEVLELIAAGMSNKEIAGRLGVSINTARTHVRSIYSKLGVNRRVQVASMAKELANRKTP